MDTSGSYQGYAISTRERTTSEIKASLPTAKWCALFGFIASLIMTYCIWKSATKRQKDCHAEFSRREVKYIRSK